MLLMLLISLKQRSTSTRLGVQYRGVRFDRVLWARYKDVRWGKGGNAGKLDRRLWLKSKWRNSGRCSVPGKEVRWLLDRCRLCSKGAEQSACKQTHADRG
jgi:hypothetical protein